jgi:hypothetical protein
MFRCKRISEASPAQSETDDAQAEEGPPLFTYSGNGSFSVSGGTFDLETGNGVLYICTSTNGTGRLARSPARTAELTVTISGCEAPGFKCRSAGLNV